METFIAQFGYHWFWFGLGSLLLVAEAVKESRFMFMAASVGALAVGVLSHLYPYVHFTIQLLFFVVLAGGCMWITRSFLNERQTKINKQQHLLRSRHYVGRQLTLISPIENGRTTLNLEGMVWTVKGEDCPAGAQVTVVDMGEGWLQVAPVSS